MIYDEIADTLLRAGIPVNTKGFIYIHDALELMDKDPYYFSGKICALYAKILNWRALPTERQTFFRSL